MAQHVDYSVEEGVAFITVANPPINALSQTVRAGLDAAVARFAEDGAARVAVISGDGKLFIAGADISEFGKPAQAPFLTDVIDRIEVSPKPVVAAIHGAALGGGLEIALGAHYRVAMAGTSLGLPEVTLGIIPGAGGTQRLPRLVGVEAALRMITRGRPVDAVAALELGLVDRIGEGRDARAAGHAYAAELLSGGAGARAVGALPRPEAPAGLLDAWRKRAGERARGEIAPQAAVDAVAAATRCDLAEGLAEERRLFDEMMETPQRASLIHAFFSERKVAKLPEIAGVAPREVARIGVVGGGTMGSGIATAALIAGLGVTLVERDDAAAGRARETITGNLDAAVERGKLGTAARETALGERLATAIGTDALGEADLIVEAVFEDMEVKKAVFATLDRVARPGAVLATNTSYLDVNAIAGATSRPGDVIGLHFFSPAHIMKLIEVVVAARTAPEVVATSFALAKRMGKIAVRAGVCDGFIGNRILSRFRSAADNMVLDGASPFQIDRAIADFGFAMGPYAVADLAGIDIGYMTRQRKAADRHPRDRVPIFADRLYGMGRLGRKTGRGYYIYDDESPKGRAGPEVEEIVAEARAAAGIAPRSFSEDEIVRRYMAAMVDEGARVVADGIAQRPLDVDVVLLHGYGFPRWRGGPMKWADMAGLDRIAADIRRFAEEDDHFWQPAPLLDRLVAEGRDFDSLNAKP